MYSGRTFSASGITGMAPGPVIRFENDAQFAMDGMNTEEFYWGLSFVSNGTIRAYNNPSNCLADFFCFTFFVSLRF